MPNGNSLTALALLLVIPATIALFAKLRVTAATTWVVLVGLYFLPELCYFNLPILPDIQKHRMVVLCCGIAQLVVAKREYRDAKLMRSKEWVLLLLLPFAKIATILTNMDMPAGVAGANTLLDIPAYVIIDMLDITGVFVIARMVYRTIADATLLLKALASCALIYLPFILLEMFLGPVCHQWLYGFIQHSFEQSVRGSGFRPMVFMSHGLTLALTMYITTAGTVILARSTKPRIFGIPSRFVAIGLLVLVPFLRSSAALVYTCLTTVALVLLTPKAQVRLASWVLLASWLYVPVRILDLLPVWRIIGFLAKFSPDRAGSLGFRFHSEDLLVARALERPIFGWGGWGRNLPPGVIPDGAWIIYFGGGGVFQLVIVFGLLGFPIFIAKRRLERASPEAQVIIGGLSLVVAFCIVDLLPNAMGSCMLCFIPGALAGLAWGLPDDKKNGYVQLLLAWYLLKRRQRSKEPCATDPMRPGTSG